MRISKLGIPLCAMFLCAIPFVPEKYMGKIPDFEPDPYDSTKANLPAIHYGTIWDLTTVVKYRNQDNKTNELAQFSFTSDCARMLALYEAIQKYSSKEKPNITKTRAFREEVVMNTLTPPRHGTNVDAFLKPFNKLYEKFIKEDSDGGSEITPSEYTDMMASWRESIYHEQFTYF